MLKYTKFYDSSHEISIKFMICSRAHEKKLTSSPLPRPGKGRKKIEFITYFLCGEGISPLSGAATPGSTRRGKRGRG
jgi:hypothetical protein